MLIMSSDGRRQILEIWRALRQGQTVKHELETRNTSSEGSEIGVEVSEGVKAK